MQSDCLMLFRNVAIIKFAVVRACFKCDRNMWSYYIDHLAVIGSDLKCVLALLKYFIYYNR